MSSSSESESNRFVVAAAFLTGACLGLAGACAVTAGRLSSSRILIIG